MKGVRIPKAQLEKKQSEASTSGATRLSGGII